MDLPLGNYPGTPINPIEINTYEDLMRIGTEDIDPNREELGNWTIYKHYKLTQDLTCSETHTSTPLPIILRGSIDGDGYTIYDLHIEDTSNPSNAAFLEENRGTVKNLTFVNPVINMPARQVSVIVQVNGGGGRNG